MIRTIAACMAKHDKTKEGGREERERDRESMSERKRVRESTQALTEWTQHLNQKLAILLHILVSSIVLLLLLGFHGHVDVDTKLLAV